MKTTILQAPAYVAFVALTLSGCPGKSPLAHPPDGEPDDRDRPIGATRFLSADAVPDNRAQGPTDGTGGEDDNGGGAGRTVEEGDVYRVLDDGLVANLNAYRGLQLIDVSDPAQPAIVGRLQIAGEPVEMVARGDRLYVLMNRWAGYAATRYAPEVERYEGGVVAAIDVTDPTAPALLDEALVPGFVVTSRLVGDANAAALYVVANDTTATSVDPDVPTDVEASTGRTVVRSFDVSGGGEEALVPAGALDLGGTVTDVRATPEALLVASAGDWGFHSGSDVTLVDISDPHGALVLGGTVPVAGFVDDQFQMDLHQGVLRVVSAAAWDGATANTVETFDAGDLSLIDSATFGEGEQLYATLFVDQRAFFVTYQRVDPFHAFEIDAAGQITERAEFIVSGWNDFFRATLADTRLIGIGTNDAQGRTLSVSLYDITDLENASPLLARADVDIDQSWSEASYDHRAFSVIEGAVSVLSDDGVQETGLVLLPYQGYDDETGRYDTAVQLFTFSATTLTRRGVMPHGSPVRRSFVCGEDTAANLSDVTMGLFNTADPDAPATLGALELAPPYVDVLTLAGGYRARVEDRTQDLWWWGAMTSAGGAGVPDNTIAIIAPGDDPDVAVPVASLDLGAGATVYQSGDVLVAVLPRMVEGSPYPYQYVSDVDVWDVSDPTAPVHARSFTTDRIQPPRSLWYAEMDDCLGCGGGVFPYWPSPDVFAVPGALVFLSRHIEQESLGDARTCTTSASSSGDCVPDGDGGGSICTTVEGAISCTTTPGESEPACSGGFVRCTSGLPGDGGDTDAPSCVAVDASEVDTRTECWDWEQIRSWTRFSLDILDLRAPADAALSPSLALPQHDEGYGAVVDGSRVWLSYLRPAEVADASLPYVRWYTRAVDITDPAAPVVGEEINVPGSVLAVDGVTAFTEDMLWTDSGGLVTTVNRVRLEEDHAELDGIVRFTDRFVRAVRMDGAGHMLVGHGAAWMSSGNHDRLTVLDAEHVGLDTLAEVDVDAWAVLRAAVPGRALFEVPGGLLFFNLDDATRPYPQAFLAMRGWPMRLLVDGHDVVVPAGRYGIYSFDIDTHNLPVALPELPELP